MGVIDTPPDLPFCPRRRALIPVKSETELKQGPEFCLKRPIFVPSFSFVSPYISGGKASQR